MDPKEQGADGPSINSNKVTNLDYFSGGVPPLLFFTMRLDDLNELAGKSEVESGLDYSSELCFIGLAAYFEAFCKDQFAAIANIAPQTLLGFSEVRDCKLPISSLLHVLPDLSVKLGFVVAEQYDFGSARLVNGLFKDLIKVTPFSKDEIGSYSRFLRDRNLLVHHGGVCTLGYVMQKSKHNGVKTGIHSDSLVVAAKDVSKWAEFLRKVAVKTADASKNALLEFVAQNKISLDHEASKAITAFGWRWDTGPCELKRYRQDDSTAEPNGLGDPSVRPPFPSPYRFPSDPGSFGDATRCATEEITRIVLRKIGVPFDGD